MAGAPGGTIAILAMQLVSWTFSIGALKRRPISSSAEAEEKNSVRRVLYPSISGPSARIVAAEQLPVVELHDADSGPDIVAQAVELRTIEAVGSSVEDRS